MSITVAATPILVLSFSKIAAIMTAAAFSGTFYSAVNGANAMNNANNQAMQDFIQTNNNVKKLMEVNNNQFTEEVAQEVINIICKEYDTVFVSQDVLFKTLDEHGFENIQLTDDNHVSCEMEMLKLEFYRNNTEEPYTMKITTECSESEIKELLDDISSEYTSNTQEESYIKIKERLAKQGLEIAQEEVAEDDTIVLTVNID